MKHIADFALHRSSTPNKRRQVESRLRWNCDPLRSHCVQTSFKFHCTPLQARSLSKKRSPGHGFRNGSITWNNLLGPQKLFHNMFNISHDFAMASTTKIAHFSVTISGNFRITWCDRESTNFVNQWLNQASDVLQRCKSGDAFYSTFNTFIETNASKTCKVYERIRGHIPTYSN